MGIDPRDIAGAGSRRVGTTWRVPLLRVATLALLCLVGACANQGSPRGGVYGYVPADDGAGRSYPPPGPPGDPWGPYVVEASRRFNLPERWIRRVMRQESGGHAGAVSSAGAMGLMQVMPATYEILRQRYRLGDDPFDPHNNMLAGAAYLKEMFDKYGSPGFLAAYNAGPGRVDQYLAGGAPLPDETVNYLASIAPYLGDAVAPSGPLAVYAQPGGSRYAQAVLAPVTSSAFAAGCDPDAAYDPDRVCTPAPPRAAVALVAPSPLTAMPVASGGYCDPDAAYDPTRPCRTAPYVAPYSAADATPVAPVIAAAGPCDPDAAYDPSRPCRRPAPRAVYAAAPAYAPLPTYAPPQRLQFAAAGVPPGLPPTRAAMPEAAHVLTLPPGLHLQASPPVFAGVSRPVAGAWGIQVGAFAAPSLARDVADRVRIAIPDLLGGAHVALEATGAGGTILYRARLVALSSTQASQSCARLSALQKACIVVPPGA